jgi:hypothetical protein
MVCLRTCRSSLYPRENADFACRSRRARRTIIEAARWRLFQMDVGTIAVNMLVSVMTGVITGVAVGYFGFRSALKQFRNQRSFDRRLEWFEQTVRAINWFINSAWEFRTSRSSGPERLATFLEELKKLQMRWAWRSENPCCSRTAR